jgi:hypothetical protein
LSRLFLALVIAGVLGGGWHGPVAAEEGESRERGFVDLYFGGTRLFESDVPTLKFADTETVSGGRVGIWLGPNWGLTFRAWYVQSDAKETNGLSPSDLAYLGMSLELLARWRFAERWALYGSAGPAIAVTTLDVQLDPVTRKEHDARSVAVGATAAVGVEFVIYKQLRGFAEAQMSLVYPSLDLPDRSISPRLLNMYGLMGVRLGF